MAEINLALTSNKVKAESDELKMVKAARRDPTAFGDLYMLYVEQVFRYLYSRIRNMEEAEDITAQTFLAAFYAFDHFHENGHFASWLFTIARNKATDHFRQRGNITSLEDVGDLSVENDPLHAVIRSEQAEALSRLIQALPEDDRELLRLRFLADLSFPEIAHSLDRKEDAVKKSMYRLLARLHSQLEKSNE